MRLVQPTFDTAPETVAELTESGTQAEETVSTDVALFDCQRGVYPTIL